MSETPNLDMLLDPAFSDMRTAVRSAFQLGREFGRREAAEEMKARLAAVLDLQPQIESKTIGDADRHAIAIEDERYPVERGIPLPPSRARRGSVKPAVLEALNMEPFGLTYTAIANRTGANENSVRGMLNTLRTQGFAKRVGDVWTLTDQGLREANATADSDRTQNTETAEQDSGQEHSATSVQADVLY